MSKHTWTNLDTSAWWASPISKRFASLKCNYKHAAGSDRWCWGWMWVGFGKLGGSGSYGAAGKCRCPESSFKLYGTHRIYSSCFSKDILQTHLVTLIGGNCFPLWWESAVRLSTTSELLAIETKTWCSGDSFSSSSFKVISDLLGVNRCERSMSIYTMINCGLRWV